jgi:hypothetical protein
MVKGPVTNGIAANAVVAVAGCQASEKLDADAAGVS